MTLMRSLFARLGLVACAIALSACAEIEASPPSAGLQTDPINAGADIPDVIRVVQGSDRVFAVMQLRELYFLYIFNSEKVDEAELKKNASRTCESIERDLSPNRRITDVPNPEKWPQSAKAYAFLCE